MFSAEKKAADWLLIVIRAASYDTTETSHLIKSPNPDTEDIDISEPVENLQPLPMDLSIVIPSA